MFKLSKGDGDFADYSLNVVIPYIGKDDRDDPGCLGHEHSLLYSDIVFHQWVRVERLTALVASDRAALPLALRRLWNDWHSPRRLCSASAPPSARGMT